MPETPAPYGSMPQSDFEAQYARLFEAAVCTVRTPREACPTDELFAAIMRRAKMAMGAGARFIRTSLKKYAPRYALHDFSPKQRKKRAPLLHETR